MLFHKIEGAKAILRSKGVYRQVDVYQRDGKLFARWGSGFIGLRYQGDTTLPDVSWQEIDGAAYKEGTLGPVLAR